MYKLAPFTRYSGRTRLPRNVTPEQEGRESRFRAYFWGFIHALAVAYAFGGFR